MEIHSTTFCRLKVTRYFNYPLKIKFSTLAYLMFIINKNIPILFISIGTQNIYLQTHQQFGGKIVATID